MSDKFIRLALLVSSLGILLGASACSDKCSISRVEATSLESDFDYIIIKKTIDLESNRFIQNDSSTHKKIKDHVDTNAGFVILTNGYKIKRCSFYKGMTYFSSDRANPGKIYAAFFDGEINGPYKFASPE